MDKKNVGQEALLARITRTPGVCGGRPCVRGLRVRVSDILDMLASGMSAADILRDYPYLEADDIPACLFYASRSFDHPVLLAS